MEPIIWNSFEIRLDIGKIHKMRFKEVSTIQTKHRQEHTGPTQAHTDNKDCENEK